MIVVLALTDKKRPPQLPLGTTLNTLLALFATLSKFAFIPVVEGLGQRKWLWFLSKDRPLAQFEDFDDATRGPWGSLKLLFKLRRLYVSV
jgi:hypothetical protein